MDILETIAVSSQMQTNNLVNESKCVLKVKVIY